MPVKDRFHTLPRAVHDTLGEWMLIDGLPIVFDQEASHGSYIVDSRNGREHLDLFSFFASLPVGYNHPKLNEEEFMQRLTLAARSKPTNSDIYTQPMADFVKSFARTLPKGFDNLFFIEGGALAVENALKAAFDWKVRKNLDAGRGELGSQVIHFKNAFHGRSGYTLSLTNTFSQDKTKYFPKFDWPRVNTPGMTFPQTAENAAAVERAEQDSLRQIREAISAHPHDIAAIIIETIQGEGGDVHFRTEFLRELREICDQEEILLIFDEVQAGMGITSTWWAFEGHGVFPDIFAFGKKSQICGIAATDRVNEIDSVFKISSRINSTWGGNLVDMVRCQRYIEIIEQDDLLANARDVGAYLLTRLEDIAERHDVVSNARGQGLMCAFDLKDPGVRDDLRQQLTRNHTMILPSGERSLRFRPVLDFSRSDVDVAMERTEAALREL